MANQIVTWVGNADENDATAILNIGNDGAGKPISLSIGHSLELTEEQIKKINSRHILVTGNQEATVIIKDPTNPKALLRGKAVTPIGH